MFAAQCTNSFFSRCRSITSKNARRSDSDGAANGHRNVDVLHAGRVHTRLLIFERVARVIVQGEVDDHLDALLCRISQLCFVGLARGQQARIDLAEVARLDEPCGAHSQEMVHPLLAGLK